MTIRKQLIAAILTIIVASAGFAASGSTPPAEAISMCNSVYSGSNGVQSWCSAPAKKWHRPYVNCFSWWYGFYTLHGRWAYSGNSTTVFCSRNDRRTGGGYTTWSWSF